MLFTGLSFRRGTSTVLGTLIFVGIMFTAVIPMILVMRQADTFHEMRKYELARLDEERACENLHVYVYSTPLTSPILTLRVENWGNFVVNIVQIWMNDTSYLLDDFYVQPKNFYEEDLTGFTPDQDSRYFIKVTTDRGNVFFEDSGSLYCNEDGNWEAEMYAITFYISVPGGGFFDIEIKNDIGTVLTDPPFSIHKSAVDGMAIGFFSVPSAGTYYVKITRRNVGVIYNDVVIIKWPYGPKIETVRV